ncbi:MAG: hypothetical protein AB7S48_05150 [Bacteroidales bacterium]
MATLKLIVLSVGLIGLVFIGLSLKVMFGRTKKNSCESDSSDIGYNCGCGGGNNCSTNSAKKGF